MFNRLYLLIGGSAAVAALLLALFLLIQANAAKAAEIRSLKVSLATASRSLDQASRDIRRFAANEGLSAAEAAKVCAVEGSSAFDRGVQVGQAVCAARS